MALQFRAVATTVGNSGFSTSMVVAKPTGTVDDDMMLLQISSNGLETFSPPGGWTQIATQDETVGGAANRTTVYYKIAASEGADYTITVPLLRVFSIGIISWYSDVPETIVVDVSATDEESATTTSQVAPGVTTTYNNAVLHCFYTVSSHSATSPHSGMTERWETADAAASYLMTETIASAGATGTRTATTTGSVSNAAITVAIAEDIPVATPVSATWFSVWVG